MCFFIGSCRREAAQRAIQRSLDRDSMDTLLPEYAQDGLEYHPCPLDNKGETGDEEDDEEESQTTDEEVEPEIIIHDDTVIEIDDEDDSALSPQKPTITKQEPEPKPEPKPEPNSEVPKVPESSLQVAPGSAPPVEVAEAIEAIMDSEEEEKANDKSKTSSRKGTFQVGCMGHRAEVHMHA